MANSYITYQCFFDGKPDIESNIEPYTIDIVSEKTLTQKEIKELILGEFLIVRNLKAYRKK
jgi:hypothetical protein